MDRDLKHKADKAIGTAGKLIEIFTTKAKKIPVNQRNAETLKDCFGNKPAVLELLLEYHNLTVYCKSFMTEIVSCHEKLLHDTAAELKNVKRENDKLAEYRSIFDKIDEHMTDCKEDILNSVEEKLKSNTNEDLTKVIQDSVPAIVKEVVSKSGASAPLEDMVPKIVEETGKMWSDLFKTSKEEMKKQTSEAKNQSKILEKSIIAAKQKQAVENIERQKRERNISIKHIPESTKTDLNSQKVDDTAIVSEMLGIAPKDVENTYRVGKVDKNKGPRVLIAVLKSPDIAKLHHNYGRGRPVMYESKKYWINADLIQADREANYQARLRRRSQVTSSGGQHDGGQETVNF